jgi:hypothetical protein
MVLSLRSDTLVLSLRGDVRINPHFNRNFDYSYLGQDQRKCACVLVTCANPKRLFQLGGISMIKLPSTTALAAGLALAISSAITVYAADTPSGAPGTSVVPDADASKSPGAKEPAARKGSTRADKLDSGRTSSSASTPADTNARQVPDADASKSPGAKEPPAGKTSY